MLSSVQKQIEEKQAGEAQIKPTLPWYAFAAKIIVWQLVAIFIVELSLSLAGLGEEEIFKLDPVLGFKHMSNKKVTWRSEGFATSYFNADGMREHGLTVVKPPGTYRVALLGDSLAESLQVPIEQSFAYQIEQAVSQQLSCPVQVLNFGTSGYSTVQEYLQLKQQVLKYKPNLILLCYNSRDCFENWSPPDEVLTNVRPAALHLPGRKLVVDSSPVIQWMKTPRARFLKQVEFLRQNSRLWGLFSAAELDWSLHSEVYKRVLFFVTKPGKAIRKSMSELSVYWKETCAKVFTGASKLTQAKTNTVLASSGNVLTRASSQNSAESKLCLPNKSLPEAADSEQNLPKKSLPKAIYSKLSIASKNADGSSNSSKQHSPGEIAVLTKIATQQTLPTKPRDVKAAIPSQNLTKTVFQQAGRSTYEQLIVRTLGSLLAEMNAASALSGARFAVIALPVRSALSARQGMETTFNDFDFNDEVKMLQGVCKENNISLYNIHEKAKSLSAQDKDYLFFLVHLTPKGHEFVAQQLAPIVKGYVEREALK